MFEIRLFIMFFMFSSFGACWSSLADGSNAELPIRRAIIWSPPGNGQDEKSQSLQAIVHFLQSMGGIKGNEISPQTLEGYIRESTTLDDFRTLVVNALDKAVIANKWLELNVVINSHGAIGPSPDELYIWQGPVLDKHLRLAEFFDVLVEEIDRRSSVVKELLVINVAVLSCYSGRCGLEARNHKISSQSYKVTVLGFTGPNQITFGSRNGFTLKGIHSIDKRLLARGVDFCKACSWFERVGRFLNSFPIWLSESWLELGKPIVFGKYPMTTPVSNGEMFELISEILHYEFGYFSFFEFIKIIAEKSKDSGQKIALRQLAHLNSSTNPLGYIAYLFSEGKFDEAIENLIEFSTRIDLNQFGLRGSFLQLFKIILEKQKLKDLVGTMPNNWKLREDLSVRLLAQLGSLLFHQDKPDYLEEVSHQIMENEDFHTSLVSYYLFYYEKSEDKKVLRFLESRGQTQYLVDSIERIFQQNMGFSLDKNYVSDQAAVIRIIFIRALMSGNSALIKWASEKILVLARSSNPTVEYLRNTIRKTVGYWENPLFQAITIRISDILTNSDSSDGAVMIKKMRDLNAEEFRSQPIGLTEFLNLSSSSRAGRPPKKSIGKPRTRPGEKSCRHYLNPQE